MILAPPIHCKFCASKYITKSNQALWLPKSKFIEKYLQQKNKYYSFTRSLTWINSTGPDYLIPWDTHLLERTILSSPAIKKIATSKKEAGLVNFLRSGCGSKCMTLHFDSTSHAHFLARSEMKSVIFCLIAVAGLQLGEGAECHGKVSSHSSLLSTLLPQIIVPRYSLESRNHEALLTM